MLSLREICQNAGKLLSVACDFWCKTGVLSTPTVCRILPWARAPASKPEAIGRRVRASENYGSSTREHPTTTKYTMVPPSQLSIATSSVQRLVKEEASYYKELQQQEARLEKALASKDDDENAEYQLKQEVS